jgi:Tol biopolymer transport system component
MRLPVWCALLVAVAVPGASAADRNAVATRDGRIVFVAADNNGIASVNPDGSGVWGLMLGGMDGDPAWSPDGSRLAIAVHWPGNEGITVMDPQGWRNRVRLTSNPNDTHPTWSPDGRTIAFSSAGDIVLVPAAGGSQVRLTTGPAYDSEPAWSRDGSRIAFTRAFDGASHIWTVDPATGTTTLAVSAEPYAAAPSWSPRGELTYTAGDTAYVRAADGTSTRLVGPVDWGSAVTWSPDGTRLLYVSGSVIFVADRGGDHVSRLLAGRSPAWQPLPEAPGSCTLWGTRSADILVGTPGKDIICGLDGDDALLGMDGDDIVWGGGGNDWIAGGQGGDRLFGEDGADRLDSRDGRTDTVAGGRGDDTGLLEPGDARLSVERRRYDGNLAAWRPVQASGVGIPDPPERAVDGRGDDFWNSGAWPPAWIEVDLQQPTVIGRIRLVTGPQPTGVVHLVLGKGPATRGAYRLLTTVRGPTAAGQEVVLRPQRPWRGIRKLRLATAAGRNGAEWVSWQEIEVFAPPPGR